MSTLNIADTATSDPKTYILHKVKPSLPQRASHGTLYNAPHPEKEVKVPPEKTFIYLPGFGNTMSGFARSLYTIAAVEGASPE